MLAHLTANEFPLLLVVATFAVGIGVGLGIAWAVRVLRRSDR
jgi:hypothetical protein